MTRRRRRAEVESHRRMSRRMSRRMRRRRMNRRRRRERVGLDFSRGSGPAVVRPRGSDVHQRRLRRRGRTRTPRGERRRRVGGRGGSGGYRVGRTTFGAAVVARMPRVAVRFVAAAVVDEGRHPLQVRAPARASPRAALRRGHVGLPKICRTPYAAAGRGREATAGRSVRLSAGGWAIETHARAARWVIRRCARP